MYKLMNTILVLGLVCGPLLAGCGGEPRIEVVQNLRNLCNFTVSGVLDEGRCTNDAACNQIEDDFCWQPEPEGGRHVEVASQTQRGVGGDATLAVDDLVDASRRYANIKSHSVLAHVHRLQEFFQENFSRVYGR